MSQLTGPNLSAEDVKALEALRSRLMPLVYNIEQLQGEVMKYQDMPLSWPQLHRHTALLKNHLKTLHDFLNSPSPTYTTPTGEPFTHAQILSKLHTYPVPPFPTGNQEKANIAGTLLRKIPELPAEQWIEERLRTASQFARVPEDWGIESPKEEDEDAAAKKEEGDDGYGGVKRIKTNMSEDVIEDVWGATGQVFPLLSETFNLAMKSAADVIEAEPDERIQEQIDDIREGLGLKNIDWDSSSQGSSPDDGVQQSQAQAKDEQQPAGKALSLGALLQFTSTGELPKKEEAAA